MFTQGDLRRLDQEEETSSEDDGRGKKRSSSTDRRGREGDGRGLAARARSERDLSSVTAKVKVGGQVRGPEVAPQPAPGPRMRTKMRTTTIISTDGEMVVSQPSAPQYSVKGTEAVDVTRAPLSRQLAQVSGGFFLEVYLPDPQRCGAKLQDAADDLVKLYKRVSLDDDLDDALRSELLSQLSAGAGGTAATLRLVCGEEQRSQGEIATAAMASINQFLSKQGVPPQGHQGGQDLSANPYFQVTGTWRGHLVTPPAQHMIENYSNLMYQNMANQRQGGGPPHPPGIVRIYITIS